MGGCLNSRPVYVDTIAQLWRSGRIERGQVLHVDVAHDDDCGMMAGDGICSCQPIVTVRRNAA